MAEELWNTLLKFHREVAAPEIIGEIVGPLREEIASFRRETQQNFDAVWMRLERLDSKVQALTAAVRRIEERLDRTAQQSDLLELKARVAALEEKIAELESEL